MDQLNLAQFKDIIAEYMGLNIREQDDKKFIRIIDERKNYLNMSYPEYRTFLRQNSRRSEKEWQKLSNKLTTAETFFFRDKGQFSLLENKLVPELIKSRQDQRTLRLWSAGCSSGEEAYSLAILLDRILPNLSTWNIFIFGTDINIESLEKARKGFYTQWSFRRNEKKLMDEYFTEKKFGWELKDKIKNMVTFQYHNLKRDKYPDYTNGLHDFDLILCRNVFIYFDPDSVPIVLRKISRSLCEDGYFITGHAELYGKKIVDLEPKFYPESVVYQVGRTPASLKDRMKQLEKNYEKIEKNLQKKLKKKDKPKRKKITTPPPKKKIKPEKIVKKSKPQKTPAEDALEKSIANIKSLFKQGKYPEVIRNGEDLIKTHKDEEEILYLIAVSYANLGKHVKASDYCKTILKIDPYYVKAFLLLSQIAEENNEIAQAKKLLNKIIYLEPEYVAAYMELASVLDRENNRSRAAKMRNTALRILQKLPPDSLIEPYENLVVEDLIETIEEMI